MTIQSLKAIGKEQNHLKMTLGDTNLPALFWQNGAYATQLETGQPVNLIGNLQINEWNGNQNTTVHCSRYSHGHNANIRLSKQK